jgi:hypothetical protein
MMRDIYCRKFISYKEFWMLIVHLSLDAVKYDKKRNNELIKLSWIVIRYHTDQIKKNNDYVIGEVKVTINSYYGLPLTFVSKNFRYYPTHNRLHLFN